MNNTLGFNKYLKKNRDIRKCQSFRTTPPMTTPGLWQYLDVFFENSRAKNKGEVNSFSIWRSYFANTRTYQQGANKTVILIIDLVLNKSNTVYFWLVWLSLGSRIAWFSKNAISGLGCRLTSDTMVITFSASLILSCA